MDVIANIIFGFSQALSADNLLFTIAGVTLGSFGRCSSRNRPDGCNVSAFGRHFRDDPDANPSFVFRHLLRVHVWGIDHLDFAERSGRVHFRYHVYRWLQNDPEGAGGSGALHCGGRFVCCWNCQRYRSDALCTSAGGVCIKIWVSRVFRAHGRRSHRSHQHFLRLEAQSGSHGFVGNPDLHDWHGPWIRRPALYVWNTVPISRD